VHPDRVEIGLMTLLGLTAVVWVALEVRYKPLPPKARTALMWIGFIEIAVATFWQTQHGTYAW
jgi:hypothetical protein